MNTEGNMTTSFRFNVRYLKKIYLPIFIYRKLQIWK